MDTGILKYIIAEDNELDAMIVQAMADQYPRLQFSGSFHNTPDAWNAINHILPEILFLDIDMPGSNGIDLLRQLKDNVPVVILVTAYPEFALEGFELAAFDYILKPLEEQRFAAMIKRLYEYWDMKQKAQAYTIRFEQETINIRQGYEQIRILLDDIIYLEAMGDYTKLVTHSERYMVLTTLSGFAQQLSPDRFTRIHRSFVVALHKIDRINGEELGIGNRMLPIGKTYRKTVKQLLG